MSKNKNVPKEEQQNKTPMARRVAAMLGVILIAGLFVAALVLQIIGHTYANIVTALLFAVVISFFPALYLFTVVPGHLIKIYYDMKKAVVAEEKNKNK